jgi:hypothetical protein
MPDLNWPGSVLASRRQEKGQDLQRSRRATNRKDRSLSRGRCYVQNFLRFLPIFGEKNWHLYQIPMLWSKFCII